MRQPCFFGEVGGKPFGIDGGGGNHQTKIGAAIQQAAHDAEQEVDIQAALVRLINNERIVFE